MLTHDGPVVLGGTITFRADLYRNGERPKGDSFKYTWSDNSLMKHRYEVSIMITRRIRYDTSYMRAHNDNASESLV